MSDSMFPRAASAGYEIPVLSGRPARDHRIDQDDIVNLKIALGLHRDVRDVYGDPRLFTESGAR